MSVNSGQIESNYDETVDSFDEMNLKSELLRGEHHIPGKVLCVVSEWLMHWTSPNRCLRLRFRTSVSHSAACHHAGHQGSVSRPRRKIISHTVVHTHLLTHPSQGHDVIAQAQSGTGKTATFSISVLQKIDPNIKQCQALILAPTRELAQQIQKVVVAIGDFMNIECHACIGGTSVRDDMKALQEGPQIVVGTPGRVQDMIQRRFLKTDAMKMFVLDEADEMLSVSFMAYQLGGIGIE